MEVEDILKFIKKKELSSNSLFFFSPITNYLLIFQN
jgi:hypothetical protein